METSIAPSPCERSQSRASQTPRTAKPCAGCEAIFTPKHPRGKYHNDACRARATRQRQANLLDALLAPFRQPPPTAPVVGTIADERSRLRGQCDRILERLKQGPATNRELAGIALKYTGRISELKQKGHRIALIRRDHHTGLTVYALLAPQQRELGEC